MKQAISIFLIFVMSFTSVQTTWVFHYCGGHLHSIGLAGGKPEMTCCGGRMETAAAANDGEGLHTVSAPPAPCCTNHTVEISTDDCQTPQQANETAGTYPVANPVLFLSGRLSGWSEPVDSRIIQSFFPPGGLAKYTADRLALICIFRI
jgi:hypothetical protein